MTLVLQLLLCGTTGVDTTKTQRNYYTLLTTFTNPNTGRSPMQIFYFLVVFTKWRKCSDTQSLLELLRRKEGCHFFKICRCDVDSAFVC